MQDLQKLRRGDVFLFQESLFRLDHLSQVMGGDAGGHANRNALGAVDQKIRDLHRKDQGLLLRFVKIRPEIHHVLIQIPKKSLLRHLLQAGLRITHGGRAVALDVPEIPVPVHQRKALLEVLCHHHQGVIDGAVPVGMVFAHGISHDTGAFPVGPVITDAQLIHVVKSPALYGLEPVAHIRQRPGHDNAHGIIDKGLLHDLRIFCFYDLLIQIFHLR